MWPYEGDRRVFIGDGISDRFAVRTAEMVYAKEGLAKYCREGQLPFAHFHRFEDILQSEEEATLRMAVGK